MPQHSISVVGPTVVLTLRLPEGLTTRQLPNGEYEVVLEADVTLHRITVDATPTPE